MKSDHRPDEPDVEVHGATLHANLWYPRLEGAINAVEVGLVDVRAADDIRISYDFDRDGWLIEQASIFDWGVNDANPDQGWKESAFIPAWGKVEKPSWGE